MTSDNVLQPYTNDSFPSLVSLPSLISNCSVMNFNEAIRASLPTLKQVEFNYGKEKASGLVAVCLTDICLGLAFDVNPHMLKIAADEVAERWYDLKLSDLRLFRKMYLSGEIGAKPSKTFRIDTKVILEAFNDYYIQRAEVYADIAEERNRHPKDEYDTSKCIPMPDYVKESFKRLEAKRIEKMRLVDENRPKPSHKKTLEEISESEGIDILKLSEAIKSKAERRRVEENLTIPMMLILQAEMASVLYEARQDGSYLHKLIESI